MNGAEINTIKYYSSNGFDPSAPKKTKNQKILKNILKWLHANIEYLGISETQKINIHIKGEDVKGDINIFPDTKK